MLIEKYLEGGENKAILSPHSRGLEVGLQLVDFPPAPKTLCCSPTEKDRKQREPECGAVVPNVGARDPWSNKELLPGAHKSVRALLFWSFCHHAFSQSGDTNSIASVFWEGLCSFLMLKGDSHKG